MRERLKEGPDLVLTVIERAKRIFSSEPLRQKKKEHYTIAHEPSYLKEECEKKLKDPKKVLQLLSVLERIFSSREERQKKEHYTTSQAYLVEELYLHQGQRNGGQGTLQEPSLASEEFVEEEAKKPVLEPFSYRIYGGEYSHQRQNFERRDSTRRMSMCEEW